MNALAPDHADIQSNEGAEDGIAIASAVEGDVVSGGIDAGPEAAVSVSDGAITRRPVRALPAVAPGPGSNRSIPVRRSTLTESR